MDIIPLIKIKKIDFDLYDDINLQWACIEPTIKKIRGKNTTIKNQVYNQLTYGQKALLMFWILNGHARDGIIRFFEEIDYLIKGTDIWFEFKEKFNCFNDKDLLLLFNDIETFYNRYIQKNEAIKPEDYQLAEKYLNRKYKEIIPNSQKLVSKYIRDNPNEFVCFTD